VTEAQANKRIHIWVTGRVQAVGFRAFVEGKAHRLSLTGWVRNVGNDTVEAVAEGEKRRVEEFLMTVKQGPLGSRVDETRVESEPATGEFSEFSVRRSQ